MFVNPVVIILLNGLDDAQIAGRGIHLPRRWWLAAK